jgi:hypothetical protein
MEAKSARPFALPGETLTFEVVPGPSCRREDIQWTGGGEPSSGSGPRFRTSFSQGGSHTVLARCGQDSTSFPVEVCPIDRWLSDAQTFYGPSIDFSKVTVRASRVVNGPAGTGWTCNTVIRFKHPRKVEEFPQESTLIHELGHVWEHQTGQAQLLKGLVEQMSRWFKKDPYDYGGPEGLKGKERLTQFRAEGQAEILRDDWGSNQSWYTLSSQTVNGQQVPMSTPGYVDDLRRLAGAAGIGAESRRRKTVASRIDSALAAVVNGVLRALD